MSFHDETSEGVARDQRRRQDGARHLAYSCCIPLGIIEKMELSSDSSNRSSTCDCVLPRVRDCRGDRQAGFRDRKGRRSRLDAVVMGCDHGLHSAGHRGQRLSSDESPVLYNIPGSDGYNSASRRVAPSLGGHPHARQVLHRQHNHSRRSAGHYRRAVSVRPASFVHGALGVFFGNWLSVIVLMIPITLAVIHRIRLEEAVLVSALGPAYSAYCSRTKRLLPWVW
jgi:hypothetical protein